MKRNLRLLATALPLLALCSCARFATKQTDISPERTITTKAAAWTLFDAKSTLASFKAMQTDKSQSATVGGLDQSTSGTNVISALNAIAAIVQAVK